MIIVRSNQPPQNNPPAAQPSAKSSPPKKLRYFSSKYLSMAVILLAIFSFAGMSYYLLNASDEKSLVRMRVPFTQDSQKPPAPTKDLSPEPTTDPTLGWQTFANKSFSLKYPDRFTVTEEKPVPSQDYPTVYSAVRFTDSVSVITVTVAKNSQNLTNENVLGQGPGLTYAEDFLSGKTIKKFLIEGTEAVMVENLALGGTGAAADIIVIQHGKVYQITVTPLAVDLTTTNAMLTSFKMLNQEPSDLTATWKSYFDSTYFYSFKYPLTHTLEFNKVASGAPNLATVYDNSQLQVDIPKFRLEVQDPKNFGQSAITSREYLKLDLEEYVNTKWQYNKSATDSALPNRKVGPIKILTVDGKPAFSFTVTGKYIDDYTTERLGEEYTFVFTESSGYKFKIWYPTTNATYLQIFNTIIFTK